MSKTVLITGTSSGFGRLTAGRFHNEGWNVVATMRSPQKETELTKLDNVLVIRLDATDPKSIEDAITATKERFGDIDVLVNNAGIGQHGLFENYTDAEARDIFDTNVFGLMNVCRAILPLMRARRSGVVVNVSSIAGVFGGPGATIYSGSKFAVRGITQSMVFEYAKWGIKVHEVAPGAFSTGFNAAANDAWDKGEGDYGEYSRAFGALMAALRENLNKEAGKPADPNDVADVIYRCATEDMPIHNIVGADAQNIVARMEATTVDDFVNGLLANFPEPPQA